MGEVVYFPLWLLLFTPKLSATTQGECAAEQSISMDPVGDRDHPVCHPVTARVGNPWLVDGWGRKELGDFTMKEGRVQKQRFRVCLCFTGLIENKN